MEMKTEAKDSITFGSATKGCAVKCYIDFETMSDETLEKLANKARGLWIKLGGVTK